MRFLLIGGHVAGGGAGSSDYWVNFTDTDASTIVCSVNSSNNSLFTTQNFVLASSGTPGAATKYLRFDPNGNLVGTTNIKSSVNSSVEPCASLHDDNTLLATTVRYGMVGLSSGFSITYQRDYDPSNLDDTVSVATDSSGNSYIYRTGPVAGTNQLIVTKLDSSMNIVWNKSFTGGSGVQMFPIVDSFRINSSGTIVIGITRSGSGSPRGFLCINSSGSLLFARSIASRAFNGVGIDSSGNIYYSSYNASINRTTVFKLNSLGTSVWKKLLPSPLSVILGDVSAAGELYLFTTEEMYRIDTSGNFVNGRNIKYGVSLHTMGIQGIKCTADDKLLIAGYQNEASVTLAAAMLPIDASLAGTYGDVVYDTSLSLTISTGTDNLISFTPSVATMTDTTTSYTNTLSSLSVTEDLTSF
jgi:hypothetical protein